MPKISRYSPNLSNKMMADLIKNIFRARAVVNAQKIGEIEEKFRQYLGVKNAISVPSGRMGLYLILKNLGLGEANQVLLSSFNYWAVIRMISFMGLEPKYIDIDPKTCNIDSREIEKNITRSTGVILATHLYGLPCPMEEITAIAKKHNLFVIEDCVQSFAAEYRGRKTGSIGEASYFGFGITKDLFPLGGGMVATNNDSLAGKIRQEISTYGFLNRVDMCHKMLKAVIMKISTQPFIFSQLIFPFIYLSRVACGKDIVDNIFEEKEKTFEELPKKYFQLIAPRFQSDIGLEQIAQIDKMHNARIGNAEYLLKRLEGLGDICLPPYPDVDVKNIFTNFPIRCKRRDFLARELLKKGIDSSYGYMRAYGEGCNNATILERSILHVPIYPSLNKAKISYITEAIKEALRKV